MFVRSRTRPSFVPAPETLRLDVSTAGGSFRATGVELVKVLVVFAGITGSVETSRDQPFSAPPSVELLSAVATAVILIYGGNQVIHGGGVTIGVLASFVFYLQTFFDPIQIGSSTLLSFNPNGSCTSGTVFIRGSGAHQFAVRVLGTTARTRILRFDFQGGTWRTP